MTKWIKVTAIIRNEEEGETDKLLLELQGLKERSERSITIDISRIESYSKNIGSEDEQLIDVLFHSGTGTTIKMELDKFEKLLTAYENGKM